MKYSSKQYAKALYESLHGKKEEELRDLIKNFADFLIQNGDAGKAEGVIKKFSDIWNENESIVEVEAISAKKINDEALNVLEAYLQKKLDAKRVIISEKRNESLLGGVVLKYKDKIVDASLRNKLKNLEANLKS